MSQTPFVGTEKWWKERQATLREAHEEESQRHFADPNATIPDVYIPGPDCPICDEPLEYDDGWSCPVCCVLWARDGSSGERDPDDDAAALQTGDERTVSDVMWHPDDRRVFWQWGCDGRHRGTGTPDCPREPHHHHDERCNPPPIVQLLRVMTGRWPRTHRR